MKRYYIWMSTWPNGQYVAMSVPHPNEFDHLDEAQRRGETVAGGVNSEWKQIAEFSWRLLANGIPTEIFIYDRKGNKS